MVDSDGSGGSYCGSGIGGRIGYQIVRGLW